MRNQIWLALHILGVVLVPRNILVTAVWKVLADRTRNPEPDHRWGRCRRGSPGYAARPVVGKDSAYGRLKHHSKEGQACPRSPSASLVSC